LHYHMVIENSSQLLTLLAITSADTTILVFILLVLFVLSFLFSGSEMAFFSLTLKDMNMLKTRQQPSYKRIVSLLSNPKILMASLLISNCLVNIGIILISNSLMNEWIDTLGLHSAINFLIKVVVIAGVLVLFCEALPKIWATHHKIWFASTASMTVEIFNRFCRKSFSFRISNNERQSTG
jgi:putative hemolysin